MFITIIMRKIALFTHMIIIGCVGKDKSIPLYIFTITVITCHAISNSKNNCTCLISLRDTSNKAKIPKINWVPPKIPMYRRSKPGKLKLSIMKFKKRVV